MLITFLLCVYYKDSCFIPKKQEKNKLLYESPLFLNDIIKMGILLLELEPGKM